MQKLEFGNDYLGTDRFALIGHQLCHSLVRSVSLFHNDGPFLP
jgi:hypothetical protein